MIFRTANGVMAALFAFAAAVQYNDPDPWRWVIVYSGAGLVALLVAVRGVIPLTAAVIVGVVALLWGLSIALRIPSLDVYGYMFDAWEMKSEPIEEARETTGLLIVAGWMALVVARAWVARRRSAHP